LPLLRPPAHTTHKLCRAQSSGHTPRARPLLPATEEAADGISGSLGAVPFGNVSLELVGLLHKHFNGCFLLPRFSDIRFRRRRLRFLRFECWHHNPVSGCSCCWITQASSFRMAS